MSKKQTGFKIDYPGPGEVDITLNGKNVVSLCLDINGWKGIEAAEEVVDRVAKILKLSVEK
jgi:hypothetical protein